MGKRSNFKKMKNDDYPTPPGRAVTTLLPFITDIHYFAEPCAGLKRSLVIDLESRGKCCSFQADIVDPEPFDFMTLTKNHIKTSEAIITNPPWTRSVLHPFILRCIELDIQTWLLFDADWMHTNQAYEFLMYCSDIVSIGRLKWIPGSKYQSKDNCCWYRFQRDITETAYHGRTPGRD